MIGSSCEYESDEDCAERNQDVVYKRQFHEIYHQHIFSKDEEDDSRACNMLSTTEHINLRKPFKEEIDKITAIMIAQVQSNYGLRNRIVNDKLDKSLAFL